MTLIQRGLHTERSFSGKTHTLRRWTPTCGLKQTKAELAEKQISFVDSDGGPLRIFYLADVTLAVETLHTNFVSCE